MSTSRRPAALRTFGFGCLLAAVFGATLWLLLPSSPDPSRATPPPATPWVAGPGDPVEVVIPRINVASKVVPIEMGSDHVLHPPEDTSQTGWWRSSARPGSVTGQILLTGHTVHSGGGVMNRLGDLEAGDRVRIRTRRAVTTYRIIDISTWTRAQVAASADELFGQDTNHRRLVLVTCTDWVDGEYTRNIVAFAAPVRSVPVARRPAARRPESRQGPEVQPKETGSSASGSATDSRVR